MTTQVKRGTFSPEMFGEDLAAILDGLLRVQQMDAAEMASAPVPLLSPFATPTGTSWSGGWSGLAARWNLECRVSTLDEAVTTFDLMVKFRWV